MQDSGKSHIYQTKVKIHVQFSPCTFSDCFSLHHRPSTWGVTIIDPTNVPYDVILTENWPTLLMLAMLVTMETSKGRSVESGFK